MFKTNTEIMTDNVTKIIVNNKYSPIRGTTNEVDGIISVITNKKTVKVNRTEMHSVILIKLLCSEVIMDCP